MALSETVLGMNARNFLYIKKFNRRKYKLIADDKLLAKEMLLQHDVATTGLLANFTSLDDVRAFDWSGLPKNFVLKPSHGYGGRGILVVSKWDGETGQNTRGEVIDRRRIESEIFSTLDGAHSLSNLRDTALIEDRVFIHPFFKKITHKGVPDVRVIVLNGVPAMAMLRVPTIASDGKANLHLGAVGIGIDIRTGITTYGVVNGRLVTRITGKKIKVRGIKIPDWRKLLTTAVQAQKASKLGFVGIDIVLDKNRGPLVLEVNARPGLSIQIANQDSLRTRLERISGMQPETIRRGVELAQTLFADSTLVNVESGDNILGIIEKVVVYGSEKKKTVRAKIDTGAYRTSIDSSLVKELGLEEHDKVVRVRAGSGRQKRKTTHIRFKLHGREIKTIATYTERSHMRFPMIVGRRDIGDFMVDPSLLPDDVQVL